VGLIHAAEEQLLLMERHSVGTVDRLCCPKGH
jgi:hypothetical protein